MNHARYCLWLAIPWLWAGLASGAERLVWQIGEPDGSYMELAIARNHPAYRSRFARKAPVFEVGKSEARHDWPFIHPGPADDWAGRRVHPFKIRFSLADEPRGVFTLRIEFSDVQSQAPPVYAVTVGGRTGHYRLRPGGGDASPSAAHAGDGNLTLIQVGTRIGGRSSQADGGSTPGITPGATPACKDFLARA